MEITFKFGLRLQNYASDDDYKFNLVNGDSKNFITFPQASKELLENHYADLSARPFFPGLVSYMSSGPVVPMVWEGLNVVKTGRVMLGATNPADSAPGTIRGDLCIQVGRNIIHGSDSVESANKEIALWFKENELVSWTPANVNWVYE